MKAAFDDESVSFHNYPFPGASVYGKGSISYGAIRDVDPDTSPPEIRTIAGETLFVSVEQRARFLNVIREKSLAVVRRPDVWSLILEPFLDTEFSPDETEQTLNRLLEMGISETEVRRIRKDVDASMISYNLFLWEWCYLGLFDVLHAQRNSLSLKSLLHRISPKRYTRFYWEAMKTVEIGDRTPADSHGETQELDDE